MTRFKSLSFVIIGFLVAVGAVFVVSAALIRGKVADSQIYWSHYQDISSPKDRALNSLVSNLGYGGMIHQFKNYVLRKDGKRLGRIRAAAGAAQGALKAYRAVGINAEEQAAIKAISGVIADYTAKTDLVAALVAEGKTSRQIDKTVKVSDKPALEGIKVLKATLLAQRHADQGAETKIELLVALREALGYGGMIHQFKNYVLRQDAPRVAKIRARVAGAREIVAKFNSLGVNEREAAALAAISNVVNAYDKNTGLVEGLVAKGSTVEKLDKSVKISDGPAIKGFDILVGEIAAQTKAEQRQLTGNLESATLLSLIIMAFAVVSSLGLTTLTGWVLLIRIVRPTLAMTEQMNAVAEGDLGVEISGLGRDDEIGDMATAVEVFKQNAVERERLEAERAEGQVAREARAKKIDAITKDFDNSVAGILKTVTSATTEMDATANAMTSTAAQSVQRATAVAAASEQASTNVQTVATASEELSASIGEITRQVSESARITDEAVSQTEKTNQSVLGLNDAAQKIGDVVDLINDIASQTNLLALNATIEAARAGDAGKGFAVVASEVKNLANQTAKATEDIAAQITTMQEETNGAVSALQGVGETIGKINDISASVSAAVEEQAAATQEIGRNVDQAAKGTQEVTENISSVNEATSETGAAAAQVLSASEELARQADALKSTVETFLTDVRAA